MVATHTSHKSHEVCSRMTNRPPQAAAKPKVHVRGRDSGLSLGISACQQRRRACVPAHRQAAVGQASCGGAVEATGPRAVWMATVCNSGLSRGVGLLPGSLCRFGRDLELLRGGLLRLVRSCSCLLGSRSQIGGRPHSARSASLAFTPRAQHLPPPQPHTGNDHAQQACRASS